MDNISEDIKSLKILFADDDKGNFRLFEKYFKRFGINNYKGFTNGKGLLDELDINKDWDLIILDIQMKGMDGVDTLNQIKQLKLDIPVVALTAHAMSTDKQKYLDLGFNQYVSKPVSTNDFIEKIFSLVIK